MTWIILTFISDDEFESKSQKLSKKKIRKLIGDETISDELAEQLIDSLYKLSIIAYKTIK